MKFSIVFLIGLIASASAAVVKSDLEKQLTKGFLDFLQGILTEVILPPLGGALQTAAELAAQITASLAIGGIPALQALIGKRSAEQERLFENFYESFSQLFSQIVAPALNTSLQSAAIMAAQLLAGVAEGGIPALNSILSGLLG